MNLGPQIAKSRVNKEKPIFAHKKNPRKMPLESINKNKKIGIRHVLSWAKRAQDPKFHGSGTFSDFGN